MSPLSQTFQFDKAATIYRTIFITLIIATFSTHLYRSVDHQDFNVYMTAADSLRQGRDIYSIPFHADLGDDRYYLYPPVLAVVLYWLSFTGPFAVDFIWLTASVASLYGTAWSMKALHLHRASAPLCTLVLMLLPPITMSFVLGQVNMIILGLLAAAFFGAERRRHAITGTAIGIAILIKASPAILLLWMIRCARPALKPCLVTIALGAALSLLNPEGFLVWMDYGRHFGTISAAAGANVPWNYAPHRLAAAAGPSIGRVIHGSAVAFFAIIVLTARVRSDRDMLPLLSFSVCGMVGLSPIVWYEHFAWLVLPTMVLRQRMRGDRQMTAALPAMTGVLLSLFFFDHLYHLYVAKHLLGDFPLGGAATTAIVLLILCGLCRHLANGGLDPQSTSRSLHEARNDDEVPSVPATDSGSHARPRSRAS